MLNIKQMPDPNTSKEDNRDPSDNTFVKNESPIAGASEMNMNWRKAVDGSTVVVGPLLSGPIKKVKKAIELNMNKTTRPKTAIDNHSPALNISIFSF